MTEDAELPEREASITNEQPDLAGDGDQDNDADDQGDDGDDDGGGSSVGLTKRQGIILAVIGAAVLLYLLKRRSSNSGRRPQTLDEARGEDMTPQVDVEDEDDDETVEIPQDSAHPLAADEAVTEMMRESGRIGSGD